MHPLFDIRVLEVGERHVIFIDEYGVTKKMMRADFDRSDGKMAAAGATSGMSRILENYPSICCNAGVDKTAVARGGNDLEDEMKRRFRTAWQIGRYTPALDHGFPPDISWENARRYAELCLEMCESPVS